MKVKEVLSPKLLDLFGDKKELIGNIQIEGYQMPINEIITAFGYSIEYTPLQPSVKYNRDTKQIFIYDYQSSELKAHAKAKALGLILFDRNIN